MRYLNLLFFSIFLISCNAGDTTYMDGAETVKAGIAPVANSDGKVPPFKGINLSASMDVVLQPGSSQSVRMEGPQELIDRVTTEVNNGVWDIGYEGNGNVRNNKKLVIYITTPALELISISGSGNIDTQGTFSGQDEVSIRISGSGDLQYSANAQEIDCGISGSGDMALSGSTNAFNASISGSGDMEAFKMKANSAKVKIVGSGNVKIDVQNDMDVSIIGSGDVYYKGNPTIKKSIIGSGDVIQK
jgi:hypothetical protein